MLESAHGPAILDLGNFRMYRVVVLSVGLLAATSPVPPTFSPVQPVPSLVRAGSFAAPQELVSFPAEDGGVVYGDLYGRGVHGVVLVHGGRFDRSSWKEQAPALAANGFRVLAIDLRGYGQSRGGPDAGSPDRGFHLDVLAAVRYLREAGASRVSVVGASMGGWAAARASVAAEPGEIDALVLLAHSPIEQPEGMHGRKLFVTTRNDPGPAGTPRLVRIREQYERAPGPKELLVLEGSAHAQFIFQTDQGDDLLEAILTFLSGSPDPPPPMTAEEVAVSHVEATNAHGPERLAGLMNDDHRLIESDGPEVAGRHRVRDAWRER